MQGAYTLRRITRRGVRRIKGKRVHRTTIHCAILKRNRCGIRICNSDRQHIVLFGLICLRELRWKLKKFWVFFEYFDVPAQGSFRCNDERLNEIFDTASYTLKLWVHNGMVWDSAKRDRLVWIGDMHPETLGLLCLYGEQECIKNSLRFVRDQTTLPAFMNRIPSYSLWWIATIFLCENVKFRFFAFYI